MVKQKRYHYIAVDMALKPALEKLYERIGGHKHTITTELVREGLINFGIKSALGRRRRIGRIPK